MADSKEHSSAPTSSGIQNEGNGDPTAQEGKKQEPESSPKQPSEDSQGIDGYQEGDHVPYKRLAYEVAMRSELQKKYDDIIKQKEEARTKQLAEEGKYKELLEEQAPKVQRAEKLEQIVQKTVEQLLDKIPEDRRKLIPSSLSIEDKLDYIHANMEFLTQEPRAQNVNRGTNPGGKTTSSKTFTLEQIQDAEFYKENRQEILLAQKEGRIAK